MCLSAMLAATLAAMLVTGCSGGASSSSAETSSDRYAPRIRAADFGTTVDNPYFPLVPGSRWVYEGKTELGVERIVVEAAHETKTILGVTCVVVRDTVSVDGEIQEDTFDWYGQDHRGAVWYFGEDTKEYERGMVVSTTGSWEAGVDGARPGIVMPAHPKRGPPYRQEYYAGEAEDMAQVLRLRAPVSVPAGSFPNTLETKEFTPLQPGVVEHKYYARGVGLVLEVAVRGGSGRVELVEHTVNGAHKAP